jgi:formate dehydrogenase maturation protein FdhE
MLWIWLGRAFFWVLRLFLPPRMLPDPRRSPTIDWKAPCPACGHVGTVSVEHVVVATKPGALNAVRKSLMLFTCSLCKAHWHTKPLYVRTQKDKRPLGPDEIGGREVRGLPG